MKRIIKNDRGFTLIEMIVVMVISTLLIVAAGVGLSVFFSKYQELNAYVELQKDAVEFLNFMKNGYNVGSGSYIQFNGIANARRLEITGRSDQSGKGTGIRITPPALEEYVNSDFMHFYLNDGVIRANYVYNGVQVNTPAYIFPKRAERERVTIEYFRVSDANVNNSIYVARIDEPLCVVKVELKAKVLTSKKRYRYVEFSTIMAMKNMNRESWEDQQIGGLQ
ncbi:MAG: prepilin-type N-terminal cleavage/methylation domain-containing protein [Candidatus Cloacimonetes bacterium]|nr:prepilin-type N-terminal cleavage/methylation domain-containing protein [Candidatus Cloacimonadota bacterium]